MSWFKHFVARLPQRWQSELKRIHFRRQISNNSFVTDEPEYKILHKLINSGDWVIDVGANVGHYTKRFSEIVGTNGRVIAFEPVPTTFSLLSANAQLFTHYNVTLINAAVSDSLDIVGMTIPNFTTGLANYYMAHISSAADSALSVLSLSLDSLNINEKVSLVKIDAEGHEAFVLAGMQELIERDRPILIVENPNEEISEKLISLGYALEILPGSPNTLFKQQS